MTDHDVMVALVEFTVKMEVSAEAGDWDKVKKFDQQRELILKHAIEHDLVNVDVESMNRIDVMQKKILQLAKSERQGITQEYEKGVERLQHCQTYLDTDRQSR